MPAAAVIPAPIAYIKVVAVKKLVVGLVCVAISGLFPKGCSDMRCRCRQTFNWIVSGLHCLGAVIRLIIYCEKIRVFKAGIIAIEYVSME